MATTAERSAAVLERLFDARDARVMVTGAAFVIDGGALAA